MTTDAVAAVLAELARDEAFLFGLTQQLVRIPTVNPKFEPDPAINRETELQRVLQAALDDIGMVTESHDVFPDRPNLVGTLPGNDARGLILCGHVDVVPVGDRAKWTVDRLCCTSQRAAAVRPSRFIVTGGGRTLDARVRASGSVH